MATLIVLEDTVLAQNTSEKDNLASTLSKPVDSVSEKKSSTRLSTPTSSKYQPGILFLSLLLQGNFL